jgi:hypothetical protein
MRNDIVLINGKKAIIYYRSSKSKEKEKTKFNRDTIKVIDELLKGSDNSFLYDNGITTLNTFNDRDENRLDINRVANYIKELRKVIPNGWLMTFRYLSEKKRRYGLKKEKGAIKFLENLKAKIEAELSSKL